MVICGYMDDYSGFLTVLQFAERMSVSRDQVILWIKNKKIAALRLNEGPRSPWRIPATELLRFRALAYGEEPV